VPARGRGCAGLAAGAVPESEHGALRTRRQAKKNEKAAEAR
jgi:hypothetical protein